MKVLSLTIESWSFQNQLLPQITLLWQKLQRDTQFGNPNDHEKLTICKKDV